MRSDMIKKGKERAPHRSLLKAAGVADADMGKPFIAICNSYTDIVPGHVHLDKVGEYLKRVVRAAGGVPFVFNTIAVDDGIAMGHTGMKYSLPSREIIADAVETMLNSHCLDAMICVPNCDKIVPGMYMGAMRCNVPTVFVSGGPMEAGRLSDGRKADLIDVFYGVARNATGELDDAGLKELEDLACPGCGSCSGLFTANSMNCLSEALGMALPGNGTTLATSPARKALFDLAARRIVAMALEWDGTGLSDNYPLLPRNICSPKAFANAMVLDMAMGGSSNTVLHLLAIAKEAGVPFTLEDIERICARSPNICRVAPSSTPEGRIYHIQDCHRAGGIHTILGQIAMDLPGLLAEDALTVTGKTLGENIGEYSLRNGRTSEPARRLYAEGWQPTGKSIAQVGRELLGETPAAPPPPAPADDGFDAYDVIRPVERAFTRQGGLVVLRGNIARDGAVVKLAGVDPQMYVFSGPARIFESQEDACSGILGGQVRPGDVVVIRNEGPKGGPGMQEMLAPTSYIKGAGLGDKVALITDGRFSGGTAGACIGHISPEAAAGGEIGLLKNGDIIELDLPAARMNARVSPAEFARRRKSWRPPAPRYTTGWLARYTALATSADTGGVLDVSQLNGQARSAARKLAARKPPARRAATKRTAIRGKSAKPARKRRP